MTESGESSPGEDLPIGEARMTSPETEQDRPSATMPPESEQDRRSSLSSSPNPGRRTISRLTLGSVLLGLDAVSEQLEQAEAIEEQTIRATTEPRTPDSVLLPRSEWEEVLGETTAESARYLTIGMMTDARNKVSSGSKLLRRSSDAVYNVMEIFLRPFRTSRATAPLRKNFQRMEERGQSQVNYWMNLGRSEDVHSRTLAQSTLDQIVDESMDDLVDNQRVQIFIQEIVQAQSAGFVDEAIEEVRERTVTLDMVAEKPVRSIFRRPDRDHIPRPDFNPLLAAQSKNLPPHLVERTMLGSYAGFVGRLLALAVDIAVIIAFLGLSTWFISNMISLLNLGEYFSSVLSSDTVVGVIGTLFVSLYALLVVIAYALVTWGLTGQTVGMMMLGIRIVSINGQRITLGQSIRRVIGFVIAALPFFLGFFWVLGDNRRQGWHDKIAGTLVVYSWPAKPDENFLRELIE